MVKFRTTIIAVALFFCLLFTLSIARDAAEKDESTVQISLPLSETTVLCLPSDPVNTETESNSAAVPFRFRPVNRRFRVRSGHPCRHHFKFYPTMRVNEEIPYGNDMLVSTDERSNLRRIRGRWAKMHHHKVHHDHDSDSDDDEDDDRLKKLVLKRNQKKLKLHFWSGKEKRKEGGFMKRVRKFLENYF